MKKIAIVYGSSVGNTRFVAEKIHARFPEADLIPAETADLKALGEYDVLIMGTSTWGVGQLQDDFETFVENFVTLDLSGKTIALFGLGDQQTYPDTFCNGMGKLYEALEDQKPNFIGQWPDDDYDYSQSIAVKDGMFVGLALDEDNEPDLTDSRIEAWSEVVKKAIDESA
ncbi:MAG: flavodoxin [Marinilabilia sp.]